MRGLNKKISAWVEHGIIAPDQAARIQDFEQSGSAKHNWSLWGVVIVGVSAIAIGIVSVIAANWDFIPPLLKLVNYLLLQSLAGYFLYRHLDRPGIVREALTIFFALIFFAGIGLTGQIFHLKSDGYSALLFWCGLTLATTLLSAGRPMNYLWFMVLLIAHGTWTISAMGGHPDANALARCFWVSGLMLYAYFFVGVFQSRRWRLPPYFSEALSVLSFLVIFFGSSVLGTVFWYIGIADALDHSDRELKALLHTQFLPWVGALTAVAAMCLRKPALEPRLRNTLITLFFAMAAFLSVPISFSLPASRALGAIFSIGVWSIAGLAAVYANRRRLFDVITLCITVRLVVVYFEVFGSMLETGVGLIVSGVLILVAAWVWYRYRAKLVGWIGQAS